MERDFLEKAEHRLAHAAMIKTISGRCLRGNLLAVLRSVMTVRILLPDPLRGGIYINLHDHAQANFIRQPQKKIEILEMVMSFFRFAHVPLYPCANRVKAQTLDLD